MSNNIPGFAVTVPPREPTKYYRWFTTEELQSILLTHLISGGHSVPRGAVKLLTRVTQNNESHNGGVSVSFEVPYEGP